MTLISGSDHRRDAAGKTYVYAVVSRRAGGVSVGINLNPNNACNWRCVYCQVPGLHRGAPPNVDLAQLDSELRLTLSAIQGETACSPEGRILDVAFSGNGESTLSPLFFDAVDRVRRVLCDMGLSGSVKLRLITNGSRILHHDVQRGLDLIAREKGEVWFKVDGGSRAAFARINDVDLVPDGVVERLSRCADLAPTWVQTCVFGMDGNAPDELWLKDYLSLLRSAGPRKLRGVLLYGIARPSMQLESSRLFRLRADQIDEIAEEIRKLGLTVQVSP